MVKDSPLNLTNFEQIEWFIIQSRTGNRGTWMYLIYIKVPKKGSSAPLPIVVRRLMCLSSIACNTDYAHPSHPVFSFGPLLSQCCSVSQINGSGQASHKWPFRRDSPSCSESAEMCHVDSFCVTKCPCVDKIARKLNPPPLSLSLSKQESFFHRKRVCMANFSGFWATRTCHFKFKYFVCVCINDTILGVCHFYWDGDTPVFVLVVNFEIYIDLLVLYQPPQKCLDQFGKT